MFKAFLDLNAANVLEEKENLIYFNWNHIDQWKLVRQVVSCQEHVVWLTAEQEPAKDVIDAKKRKIENIEIYEVYECVSDLG